MIPAITPDISWTGDPALCYPRRDSYPIVTKDQQYALFREQETSYYGADSGIWQPGGHGPSAWIDRPVFNGEVWTVQVNNQPGYYTTPQNMMVAAVSSAYWSSEGIGDWQMADGWQSGGWGPYG